MINYDCNGRMKYNPELHDRQGQPWTVEETQYLIEWYNIIGIEEMALALGRTETTIATRVTRLRADGLMEKKEMHNEKLLKHYGEENIIWRIYG